MNRLICLIVTLTLCACSIPNEKKLVSQVSDCFNHFEVQSGSLRSVYCEDHKEWRKFVGSGYVVNIPGNMFKFGNDDKINFDINPTNNQEDLDEKIVDIFPVQTCAASVIGTGNIESMPNTNGNTIWGRADYFDTDDYVGLDPDLLPSCRPPHLVDSPDAEPQPLDLSHNVAYVLCSEKNGKRVLICISQQTNDPTIAKQIFETFKWIDK